MSTNSVNPNMSISRTLHHATARILAKQYQGMSRTSWEELRTYLAIEDSTLADHALLTLRTILQHSNDRRLNRLPLLYAKLIIRDALELVIADNLKIAAGVFIHDLYVFEEMTIRISWEKWLGVTHLSEVLRLVKLKHKGRRVFEQSISRVFQSVYQYSVQNDIREFTTQDIDNIIEIAPSIIALQKR